MPLSIKIRPGKFEKWYLYVEDVTNIKNSHPFVLSICQFRAINDP
jgi:hypothetical protein